MFNPAKDIDAYFEYTRIVGKDDGGKLMSPEEFEAYKARVIPQREKNRLFTSWTNPAGMDCTLVGPQTKCFCLHRYIDHKTDYETLPSERPVPTPCREKGCKCRGFEYLPWSGGGPIRCTCKHPGDTHSADPKHKCVKAGCKCEGFKSSYTCNCAQPYSAHTIIIESRSEREKRFLSYRLRGTGCKCEGFKSSYTCNCAQPYSAHTMIIESRSEREKRGKPVGREVGYQAMGGLTGFSSLAAGYQRLDASGVGEPSAAVLEAADGHTFVRALGGSEGETPVAEGRRAPKKKTNVK